MKRISRNSGFTLVEVMMVVFIFLLLITGIMTMLVASRRFWLAGDARIEAQQEIRKAIDWVSDELRQAGLSTISGVPSNGTWYNSITFQVPQTVIDGYIIWDTPSIQYFLGGSTGTQLIRRQGVTEKIIANNISSFQVRRQFATRRVVEISIQAQCQGINESVTVDIDSQIRLRN